MLRLLLPLLKSPRKAARAAAVAMVSVVANVLNVVSAMAKRVVTDKVASAERRAKAVKVAAHRVKIAH